MGKTKKDNKYTKKELVTDPIHRKAGPHKQKDKTPKVCPTCKGNLIDVDGYDGTPEVCGRCGGDGVIYE